MCQWRFSGVDIFFFYMHTHTNINRFGLCQLDLYMKRHLHQRPSPNSGDQDSMQFDKGSWFCLQQVVLLLCFSGLLLAIVCCYLALQLI